MRVQHNVLHRVLQEEPVLQLFQEVVEVADELGAGAAGAGGVSDWSQREQGVRTRGRKRRHTLTMFSNKP